MTVGDFTRLKLGSGLTGTNLGSGVIQLAAATVDPAADTKVWVPLFDSDGSLVIDSDEAIIPTLIPIA